MITENEKTFKMEMTEDEIKEAIFNNLMFTKSFGDNASKVIDINIEQIMDNIDEFHMMRLFKHFGINNRIVVNFIIDSFIDGILVGAGVYFEETK